MSLNILYQNLLLSLVLVSLLINIELVCGKTCPGKCVNNASICTEKYNGKVVGYCTTESPCCDFTANQIGSCGAKKEGSKFAIFQSPNYPDYSSEDLNCEFTFDVSSQQFDGIMVEFIDLDSEGPGFAPRSPCETDMLFLTGFGNWKPPARCGNLTGYVAVIDKGRNNMNIDTLKILALMSSSFYKWKIKISLLNQHLKDVATKQINCDCPTKNTITKKRSLNNNVAQSFPSTDDDNEDSEDIVRPLVVNGKDVNITEVPWQVSLRSFYPPHVLKRVAKTNNDTDKYNREKEGCNLEGQHFCGGSIISNQHILTALHCFHPFSKAHGWKHVDYVKVFLGETDLCKDDYEKYGRVPQNYSIDKIIYHYAYDDTNELMNDVVVIKLKEKIKFTDYIKPIALSKRNKSYGGRQVKVSGWGLTNLTDPGATLPLILQATDEIFVENATICDNYLEKGFSETKARVESYTKYKGTFGSVICTNFGNNSVYKLVGQGDSGGPLIFFDKSESSSSPIPIQIGIVSYALSVFEAKNEHDNTFLDFFQDVSYYREWIDLAMMV